MVFFRDVVTLFLELSISILSIVYFKKYLKNRKRVFYTSIDVQRRAQPVGTTEATSVNCVTNLNIALPSLNYNEKSKTINFGIFNANQQPHASQSHTQTVTFAPNASVRFDHVLNRAENYNAKLTKMTIYLSICSIFFHIIVAITYIGLIINDNTLPAHVYFLLLLVLYHIKCISNFFFFFNFNTNFRNYVFSSMISILGINM